MAFLVMGSEDGLREQDEISLDLDLDLALGVPTQQRFSGILVEPLAAKWGTCLQLQNGHIYVNCVGQHQSQGLKLDLPPSIPKGESAAVKQGMDLSLSLSIHVSPPKYEDKARKPPAAQLVIGNQKSNAALDLSPSDPTISSGSASSSSLVRSSPSSSSSCHHPQLHHKRKVDSSNNNNNKTKSPVNVGGDEMVTVGCAHCLIYVLMRQGDPKCPRCGTTSLLGFNVPQPTPANDLTCKRQKTEEYL